ncbi:amidohydrolase [Rhodohalobacter sp. SW132]|uniref:amidohydrolase family protein n=1 Tax=Rhodohalobacter sp. SW132 TaxID=2293433 RepID=UPI000E226A15|nr:amidohydrolase family protein [Rhodohalobacter sp. SW132]REL33073.1 amidohydrolase [Rhodohalobacter sp. SW132]
MITKNKFRNYFYSLICLVAFSSFFMVGLSADKSGEINNFGVYAFTDVNVVPMDEERILENHTVIVRDGRISSVAPSGDIEIPENAEQIDGSDKYLMPGLTEMHGHIPGSDNPQYVEDVLFLYISNGVTTVRNMAGNPYHIELRDKVAEGEVTGPTIFAATPWLSSNSVSGPEDAERAVREYKEAGFDHMKMGSLPQDTYLAVAEASQEIGLPFAGHIPEGVGLVNALEAGQKSIDHYDRYVEFLVPDDAGWDGSNPGFFGSAVVHLADASRISEAVERTIEAGTWNVPTLSLVEHLASEVPAEEMAEWPEMKYMPADVVDGWVNSKRDFQARDDFQPEAANRLVEIRQILTKELHDSGAPIALGSDAPQFFNVPGFSIHHELEMMVATGLSPYEVLVTGTKNPAIYYDTPDEFGTVEENRRADLILLNQNPLQDIANVSDRAGVMVRGEWWPEEKIQERLNQIANN